MQDKVNLTISGDLGSMTLNWSQEENEYHRRLVRFGRVQEGSNIHLTFEPVDQDEYVESHIVVSCIQRRDADDCYITSVDIIYLLEAIVGNRFSVEEKNRIRRNLEGFKPMTVSKSKNNSDFFSLIMGFPHPRPRNIEKDVKVFSWKLLKKALEKIVGKYVSDILLHFI
ncbi:hypothetical protein BS47DRAFT_1298007 [Hydnum rufescens UP504]|uniref:DUF7082 domain-containing protein n=1 Tax=Hydnum rufescens UP504 TaxID=1448309 RepID=A0A9P6DV12_9AGAM|nr:hypothetical protein BS47DRAFT_1298007 [Hydnum rufescens UP504]